MKLSSCKVLRRFHSLALLMFVTLSLCGALVPLWTIRVSRIKKEVRVISDNIHQELTSQFDAIVSLLSPINASAINLVRLLSPSLSESELQFSDIASKVASILFQASLTIPFLSQISYIDSDGLLFAYYTKNNQLFGLYSNSTFSSTNYTWYVQLANRDTGKLYGEAVKFPPPSSNDLVNSSWFQSALNSTKSYSSLGIKWGYDSDSNQDIVFLSTAGINGRSAISLGFPMKLLLEFLTSIDFYNGSLYLATKDGNRVLPFQEWMIPNTRLIFSIKDQVSFELLGFDGSHVGKVMCHSRNSMLRDNTVLLRIWGQKYVVSCSAIEFAGLKLVYVLASPFNDLWSGVIVKNMRLPFISLMVMVGAIVMINIYSFVYMIVEGARREMYLCGALIKQMEATQQAERKSMNKSLAFASASHDIRASLAGITGLIEVCQNELVSKRDRLRSELHSNLLQMEGCTRDLLGILNSILETSKIEAGKMHLEEEEFNIEQTLEDVVDLFHPLGTKKGVDVILDPYDGSMRKSYNVKGDRGKLRQILCNLLSNAVKFTSEGYVTVRAWARKPSLENEMAVASNNHNSARCLLCLFFKIDKACSESSDVVSAIQRDASNWMEFVFEVNDTGKGIPKDEQKSVFENYVQVRETSLVHEGTGLGLGIVQSLVRLMGGDIDIMDKEVGERGTCFRFNVFFIICDTKSLTMAREASDIEACGGDNIPMGDSFHDSRRILRTHHIPKNEGSQVLFFLQNPKRSNVLQSFMVRNGIKAHIVKQHEQLGSTLQKLKKELRLSHHSSSGKSDVNSRSDSSILSHLSSSRSKEVSLSSMAGLDFENISCTEKKSHNLRGGFLRSILMVIDTRAGPVREISRVVALFRRDLNNRCCCQVIWLDGLSTEDGTGLFGLDEDKLPQSDFVMSKPFHGSRFYQALGLLPEFGKRGEITTPRNPGDMCGSKLDYHVEGSLLKSKSEIEEITEGQNTRMPMKGKKILIADDEHVGRKIVTTLVSQLGAKTCSCVNGKEAWELVRQSLHDRKTSSVEPLMDSLPFDCILMDCMMPEMDGIEATKKIREEEIGFGIHIPIIALTAHQWGEEISMMIQAGADDYITKPAKKDHLLKAMSKLIS